MDLTLYIGHDDREAVGTHVFFQSLLSTASHPVPLVVLHKPMLYRMGIELKDGTNVFTMSRFLAPFFNHWHGWALFMDGADMLMREDVHKIMQYADPTKAVLVVQHAYKTKHPMKYVGTGMEAKNTDYLRKNWASVMLMNCNHYAWRRIVPEYVEKASKMHMLQFEWLRPEYLAELPAEWNWLVDEYGPNEQAAVLHWTCGVPGFPAYRSSPHADEWQAALAAANHRID